MFGLQLGRLGTTGSRPWSESALWPLGAASSGMWIDGPSYPAACWQDSAGTTALSAVGTVLDSSNPVGLILDRKGGLVLGPELVTNGDFSNGTTGWSAGYASTIAVEAGQLVVTATGAHGRGLSDITTVVGKTYKITATFGNTAGVTRCFLGISSTSGANMTGFVSAPLGQVITASAYFVALVATTTVVIGNNGGQVGDVFVADNVSVREIPGLHLSQSTSAARPVASARVNLLTYSDDFSNSAWQVFGGPAKVGAAPFAGPSGSTAYEFSMGSTGGAISSAGAIYQSLSAQNGLVKVQSIYVRAKTGTSSIRLSFNDGNSDRGSADLSISDAAWTRLTFSSAVAAGALWNFAIRNNVAGNSGNIYVADAQFETGTTPSNYQRVGAASDYTTTGFPQYLKFDGVDDALSSATFAAGTLAGLTDCLIAVRRDSAADCLIGIYGSAGKWFGYAANGGSGSSLLSVGTPTSWVDGTQLSGGTATTSGAVYTALSPGAWHIYEMRGLDLSTWTAISFGGFGGGLNVNGALGKIELFASGQDAARDKARDRMAAYFGVTLP